MKKNKQERLSDKSLCELEKLKEKIEFEIGLKEEELEPQKYSDKDLELIKKQLQEKINYMLDVRIKELIECLNNCEENPISIELCYSIGSDKLNVHRDNIEIDGESIFFDFNSFKQENFEYLNLDELKKQRKDNE